MKRKVKNSRSLTEKNWVTDAMAFFAISLVDFFPGFAGTTIPTIVLAATVVVLVVTEPVALEFFFSTPTIALALLFWIKARTVFAVRLYDLFVFLGLVTAIAAIILAMTVVVFVIAVAIAHIVLSYAFPWTLRILLWSVRILALAYFAVSFYNILSAAVAAIILAFFDVVVVITVPISLVLRRTARRFVIRVLALANFAVSFFDFRTTAVAVIIVTRFVIVLVVTVPVAHVVGSATFWWFVIRVLALALLAVGFYNL